MENVITFKKAGRADYMGFAWFKVYVNESPLMEQGVHLSYHAFNEDHALKMHNQLMKTREQPGYITKAEIRSWE